MPHPMKVYVKNRGPGWLKGLDKYIETPRNEEVSKRDAKVTQRYQGGDRQDIDDAAGIEKGRR